jgi:uncharacterized paraquat-inducible protein A
MIEIELQTFFELYVLFAMIALVILAIQERVRESAQTWELSEDRLCQCSDCHLSFVVTRKETTARCPRCEKVCTISRKTTR